MLYIDIQLFLLCLSLPSHPFSGILEIIKRLGSLEDVGCFSVFLIMYLGPHLLTFRVRVRVRFNGRVRVRVRDFS